MAIRPGVDLRHPPRRARGARRNRFVKRRGDGPSRRTVLWGIALLCVVAAATAAGFAWSRWAPSIDFRNLVPTIQNVQLYGPLREIKRADVLAALAPLAGPESAVGGRDFFRFDARAARAALERLPWVQRAEVRKQWPDTLTITIREQRAVAIWAAGGYLNEAGDRFVPAAAGADAGALPTLSGPPGTGRELFGLYDAIHARLSLVGLRAARLEMDERGALTLTLAEGGVKALLGRDRTLRRVERLTQVYARLRRAAPGAVETVDLRYARGLALRLKQRESGRDAAHAEG